MSAANHASWANRENRRLQRSYRRELGISLPATGGDSCPETKGTTCLKVARRIENDRHRRDMSIGLKIILAVGVTLALYLLTTGSF